MWDTPKKIKTQNDVVGFWRKIPLPKHLVKSQNFILPPSEILLLLYLSHKVSLSANCLSKLLAKILLSHKVFPVESLRNQTTLAFPLKGCNSMINFCPKLISLGCLNFCPLPLSATFLSSAPYLCRPVAPTLSLSSSGLGSSKPENGTTWHRRGRVRILQTLLLSKRIRQVRQEIRPQARRYQCHRWTGYTLQCFYM